MESHHPDLLLELVADLSVHGVERSFKLVPGGVLANRLLLGVAKESLGDAADTLLLRVCRQLGMPLSLYNEYREKLGDVTFVLFGYEENERGCIYKAYLEYYDSITSPGSADGTESFLLHHGFKWDAEDPGRTATTRYTWYPGISVARILDRMTTLKEENDADFGLEAAKQLFLTGANRVTRKDLMFLEIAQNGSRRSSSIDINLYAAQLRVDSAEALLFDLAHHYSVPERAFFSLYQRISGALLGHIACGFDRRGERFFTLYYELPQDDPGTHRFGRRD